MNFFFTFLCFFFLFSCTSTNKKLDFALQQAGKNRSEIEKVLNHYKNDSLKYRSAVFLIENMPYHTYLESSEIDSTKTLLSNIFKKWSLSEEERQKGIFYQRTSSPIIKQDIREIKADLLIENIDYAFKVWKERPWNKHLPFDDFCELILPHRIAEEPLTYWRKKYYEKYNPILDSLHQGTDIVDAYNALFNYIIKEEKFYYFGEFSIPRQGASFQFNNRIGTCQNICDVITYIFRSVGFPITTDFYLYSTEYQSYHSWNVLRDSTGSYFPVLYEDNFYLTRDENFTDKRKKGKVFRMTYGLQLPIEELHRLPLSLQNPFMKDVTSEYFGKNKVSIPFEGKVKNVFTGIFTARNGWLPVSKGKIENKNVIFENIEPFVIYQPLAYKNNELIPVTYPFMYKKNKVHVFIPENEKQEIVLTRKYPLRKTISVQYKNWLLLTEIKGSNNSQFSNSDLLHKMEKIPPKNVIEININSQKSYRYFQYQVPKDSVLSIAEIHFFDENNKTITFDSVYSNGKPREDINLYQLKNCYDNDPASFFHTWEKGASIFFKSNTPQKLKRIQIVPRNDDNFIREGDIYELFYNGGEKGWVSLGERKATKEPVLYYNAPKNAVLWLKNKTRGKEEQIFIYENGRQVFPTFEEYGK